ncbi:UDP-N-acetylmuramoyl-tripeptide--D-alanyl-D-alanine ligase, partial [Candidatus Fermentibacteria bacterium]|nr:UDP-N-acetylmuramoyl-tripeptide--D-alanyl-D-alanine ligase [Candidatus Fermentibacteria bacterium]
MNFTLSFAARAAGAPPPAEDADLSGACIDSREAGPGKLFFALAGTRADGHDFVGEVLASGGSAVVSREGWSGRVVRVGDVGGAMLEVARAIREGWRDRAGGSGGPRTVIGVTGSNGKTTTRHLIEMALSPSMRTGGTCGNLNNHIGLPLSVMNLDPKAEAAVLEAGMNHEGELRRLGRVMAPDVSVVTCIGRAHIEYFGSLEAVARAKAELLEETAPGGLCFVPPGWSAL